jgi:NAD(P)-dependent dehydrogenase (short-subunit alcohol dehydrogenase family)
MTQPALAGVPPVQRAVLVTGASSGIGLEITERLAADGYYVYAGARKAEDLERLSRMDNVSAVKLDVTVQDDVDAAVAFIKGEGRGLWGLVNNAGVAAVGAVAETSQRDLDYQFGVNVFGVHRVTRAFLPLIIESKGRITTIGSISGYIAEENASTYCMTKFAMEAFTDSLAREMEPLGVTVNIVEPGSFRTPIWRKMADRQLEQASQAGKASAELRRRDREFRCGSAGTGCSGRCRGACALLGNAQTSLYGDTRPGAGRDYVADGAPSCCGAESRPQIQLQPRQPGRDAGRGTGRAGDEPCFPSAEVAADIGCVVSVTDPYPTWSWP